MPIEIRGRIPFHGKTPIEPSQLGKYAAFFLESPVPPTVDPSVVVRAARLQEELGYDSSLVPQNSARPDVWPVVGWALAATTRLKLVAAHRVGLQQPTVAARTVATLDRLSNGRQFIHLIQGRTDEDMQKDGDFLPKQDRYRRSHEYMEIFKRELTEDQPFSYKGEYYEVRNAWSGVRPVQRPYPKISMPGTSDAGIDLAARHADIYAVEISQPEETAKAIDRIRSRAAVYGRDIQSFWSGGTNVVLAPTDAEARQRAEQVADTIENYQKSTGPQHPINSLPNSNEAIEEDWFGQRNAWYRRLARLTRHGLSLVGSPETAAEVLLDSYRLGVNIHTLGGACEYFSSDGSDLVPARDLDLLRELIERLRLGAARIDQEQLQRQAFASREASSTVEQVAYGV